MLKQQKGNKQGFTIIEVLIVLAIAGLIMLIVFLAVPALQRSSRNTQRKNDASALAGAISNYLSNNGGTLPSTTRTDPADASAVDVWTGAGNFEAAKLGFYTPGNVSIEGSSSPSTRTPTTNTMVVDPGYNCNANNTGIGTATSRSAAILYAIETGSGATAIAQQCVEQ